MGTLKVNGSITATDSIKVNNSNSSGGVSMWEDGEGGTITIASKNNTYIYHIDAYNDETIRVHTADKNPNGTARFLSWNGKTGVLSANGFSGTATNSDKLGGYSATEFFRRGDNITASCNDVITSRSYWATDTATEKPATWGGLLDFNTGSHHQFFLSYTGNNSYVGLYTRAKVNNVWQPWVEYLNTSNYANYVLPWKVHNSGTPNFNNITTTAWNSIVASNTNSPTTGNHGLLLSEMNVGTPFQIWYPDNSLQMWKRYKPSGSDWTSWSNTWDINITGSAGSVAWGNISGKPSLMGANPGNIEMYPGTSAGHGGYIDFHYNSSSSDYTSRIIAYNGYLQVIGSVFNIGGKVELWTDSEGGNIRITSPNGSLWSIDALENSKLRFIWAERNVPFSFQNDGVFNCAAIATSSWGSSLPGSGYWGQVFFKT